MKQTKKQQLKLAAIRRFIKKQKNKLYDINRILSISINANRTDDAHFKMYQREANSLIKNLQHLDLLIL